MVAKMETSWKTQSFAKMEVETIFCTPCEKMFTRLLIFSSQKKSEFSFHYIFWQIARVRKSCKKVCCAFLFPSKQFTYPWKSEFFADFWCPKWYSLKKSHFQHCKVIWIFAQNMASEFCPFWRENSKIWNVGFIIAL